MDQEQKLQKIAGEISRCRVCREDCSGMPVPGEGSADARVVFIGEAPGREEAKTGRPFVGRSGKLLRQTIRDIGLDESAVFITSPVHYLPDRGTPSRSMVMHGREHLFKQLAVIEPEIVVLLGNTACTALLDSKVEITKQHGTTVLKDDQTCFITVHPAYAIRFAAGKKMLREDFNLLKKLIAASRKNGRAGR
jgi:DNA polymerase